jgi:hypothetical protein
MCARAVIAQGVVKILRHAKAVHQRVHVLIECARVKERKGMIWRMHVGDRRRRRSWGMGCNRTGRKTMAFLTLT